MENPQISAWTSGRAKRTAKAMAVSEQKPCLSLAARKSALQGSDRAAVLLDDLSVSQGNQP